MERERNENGGGFAFLKAERVPSEREGVLRPLDGYS